MTFFVFAAFSQNEATLKVDLKPNDVFSIEDHLTEEVSIVKSKLETEQKIHDITAVFLLNVKGKKGDSDYLELSIKSLTFENGEGEDKMSFSLEGKSLDAEEGTISILRKKETGELTFDRKEEFFSAISEAFPKDLQQDFLQQFNEGYLNSLMNDLFPHIEGTKFGLRRQLCEGEVYEKTSTHLFNYIGKCMVTELDENHAIINKNVNYIEKGKPVSNPKESLDVAGTLDEVVKIDLNKGVVLNGSFSYSDEGKVSFLPSEKQYPITRSTSRTLKTSYKNK